MTSATETDLTAMLASSPSHALLGAERTSALLNILSECSLTCEICADACLHEDSVAHLRSCITLNLDCADICVTTARLMTRPTGVALELVRSSLQHCTEMCKACADECQTHGAMMEHCRRCAESCRRCEVACAEAGGAV